MSSRSLFNRSRKASTPGRTVNPIVFETVEERTLLTAVAPLNIAPVVTDQIAAISVDSAITSSTEVDLTSHFDDADVLYRFDSVMGDIDVRMFPTATPGTVTNFQTYADAGDYDSSFIHRSVPDFIIQGGMATWSDDPAGASYIATHPPITNEPGISNVRGTIAMAKLGDNPDSATCQWFFNVGDNSENLDAQNGGFTVFGTVVGDGMDVVDAINALTTYDAGGAYTQLPLRSEPIDHVSSEHIVLFNSISQIADELAFEVVGNTNAAVISANVDAAGMLQLEYATGQAGEGQITVRATDLDGAFVDTTFDVNVTPEPATIAIMAAGGAIIATRRKRKEQNQATVAQQEDK